MHLAAIELTEDTLLIYEIALAFSGVLLAWLAISGFGSAGTGTRVLNGVFALGFLGYAGYLLIAQPENIVIFFYAFIVPIVLLVRAFQARQGQKKAQTGA
jgi:hypothetical protein